VVAPDLSPSGERVQTRELGCSVTQHAVRANHMGICFDTVQVGTPVTRYRKYLLIKF
jgi:hypothetical protein